MHADLGSPAEAPRAATDRSVEARALFEQGIAKSSREEWKDAALLFERSRELVERPATVLNLIVVYDKLGQPVQVVHMVQRLLQIADPVRHESERRQALSLEARAYALLARVALELTPVNAGLTVDGEPPQLANARLLLLMPGEHALQIHAQGYGPVREQLTVAAGESLTLRRELTPLPPVAVVAAEPPAQAPQPPPAGPVVPSLRGPRTLATLGFVALAGALVTELVAYGQASALSQQAPEERGFLSSSTTYQRTTNSVGPLAAAGGVLAAAGLLWSTRRVTRARRRGVAFAVAGISLAVGGVGAALWAARPNTIGASTLDAPTREAGMLLVAGAVPGLTWAIGELTR